MTIKVPSQFPTVDGGPKIAFLTHAPGDEEIIHKLPLMGSGGRVFNAMLRQANIDRDSIYIGQIFDEQADDNDPIRAGWLKDTGRINENFARLDEELSAFKPHVIVPLGMIPFWALTGQTTMGNNRGAVTKATVLAKGAKIIPTFHPETIQKSWHFLPMATSDLEKAVTEAGLGPGFYYPKVQLLIEPSIADLQKFVPEMLSARKLSVDIETGWGQITSIAFAVTTSRAMSVPFVDLRKPNKSYWLTAADEFAAWRIIEEVGRSPVPKVGQNFMYDLFWLHMKHGVQMRNYRRDTRLRHKVLFPPLPADLANMSATYTRVGSYKGWGGKYQKETKKDG